MRRSILYEAVAPQKYCMIYHSQVACRVSVETVAGNCTEARVVRALWGCKDVQENTVTHYDSETRTHCRTSHLET